MRWLKCLTLPLALLMFWALVPWSDALDLRVSAGAITPIIASSGNKAAATATATITSTANRMAYIEGFTITSTGSTAATIVNPTVTGVSGGTQTYTYLSVAGVTTANKTLDMRFSTPIPATGPNTNITVTMPSLGSGNTNCTVVAYGYLQ